MVGFKLFHVSDVCARLASFIANPRLLSGMHKKDTRLDCTANTAIRTCAKGQENTQHGRNEKPEQHDSKCMRQY